MDNIQGELRMAGDTDGMNPVDVYEVPAGRSMLELEADARLIAAAPDLLEALKAYFDNEHSIQEARAMALAAIAKAEGK
jgi:hypothetical protein